MVTVRATLDDLYRTDGKAELIDGRIVPDLATGIRPNEIAGNIYVSLRTYVRQSGFGRAFTDNVGFTVPELPSGRESFSPDASYYDGPLPANLMRFVHGPPTFAVEVRSENDYGNAAEDELAAKRDEYFASGTRIVWDVDPVNEVVFCYLHSSPQQAIIYRRGDLADAEPAVPGWRIPGDEIFA